MINAPSSLPAPSEPPYEPSFPFSEEDEGGGGFTLMQLWCMLRAYMWLSIGIFVVLAGTAYVLIKKLPKNYEAQATLIVNTDNIDPLAGRTFGMSGTMFATQIELIYNNVVLRPVVEQLKLADDRRFISTPVEDPRMRDETIVSKLRGALNVQPGTGSQLLYISASALDPVLASNIANAVADEFIRQTKQRTNAPAAERADRYTEQVAELKANADKAQVDVVNFRERNNMTDIDGQGADLERAKEADLQTKLLQAQDARRQLEQRQGDGRIDSTLFVEAPEMTGLRNTLDALQSELQQARLTMGPNHPKVVQLQSEIEEKRNAIRSSLSKQLRLAGDLEGKYESELAQVRQRLLDRRRLLDEGEKLVVKQKLAEEAYANALRGRDSVEFASRGNYQDVTIISRAEPPIRPSGQNKLKKFAAALAVIFVLAVGGPFAYELLLNRRIRCRDDLERSFRIVMLAEFGRMSPAPPAA